MRLYLCRHATAVDASATVADDDRWLTPQGRADAHALGERLAQWGESPDALLTSPLVRAVQTADALAAGAGFRPEVPSTASLGPDGRLSDLLAEVSERGVARVAVVGHEPLLGDWGARLLGLNRLPIGFERCMVLALDFADEPAPGAATLAFVSRPNRPERFRF